MKKFFILHMINFLFTILLILAVGTYMRGPIVIGLVIFICILNFVLSKCIDKKWSTNKIIEDNQKKKMLYFLIGIAFLSVFIGIIAFIMVHNN